MNLACTTPDSGQINLTWSASTDNVGVTGYDIYVGGSLHASVAGNVLTYTDNQPDTATVSYYVVAKDAAGNVSAASNTVTRIGSSGGGTNLAAGKTITASTSTQSYVATNANDGNLATYWESASGAYPATLAVSLGANASISSVNVKLNPDPAWATRTQTIEVLGKVQGGSSFTTLVPATVYPFDPSSGNTVTIPVSATASDVQLKFTSNSGAPGAQAVEVEVIGTPAPNPDLEITGLTWSPASPIETDSITLNAVVKNSGTASSAATTVNFYMGATKVGSASAPALAAGASATVSASIGAQTAGTYTPSAKVDEENAVIELDETNNSFTSSSSLIVNPVPSSDLVPVVSWTPNNPSAGNLVNFSVSIKNQGTITSASGAHNITLTLRNATTGDVVTTLTGSLGDAIAAGATTSPISMGTWTAANGSYTVTTSITIDSAEIPAKQSNNVQLQSFFVGRGANMPFTVIEAESSANATNGTKLSPNFNPGDFAGEASGRSAIYLDSAGKYVEFTLTSPANAFVLRSALAENTNGSVSIYANGVNKGKFNVTSKFSYLYATPSTLGRLGYDNSGTKAYWLYEDSQLMLDQVYPAGTKIKVQIDSGDVSWIYVDLLETENVTAAASNPDPSKYVEVSATKSIDQALAEFRQDTTKKGNLYPGRHVDAPRQNFHIRTRN
ncbi:CARDB domain-containing protein [Paenibacillus hexagrammi]|uniref:Discoidin domain-containing protein n=1 Tax=Paenibacillus hexagrammi TaxID=2908839 RepID=A0ABY3SEG8_9BACL|nr:CARDB domain-containing protein [Paenibacillus sp. YPD9-1]UJF31465.1 discoidin domain-containing protein [Paenibacillus sp. YPD9-1]